MEKEKIINKIVDLLISNWGEATEKHKKEIEDNISLYSSDYVKHFIQINNIVLTQDEIDDIIQKVIENFERCWKWTLQK